MAVTSEGTARYGHIGRVEKKSGIKSLGPKPSLVVIIIAVVPVRVKL